MQKTFAHPYTGRFLQSPDLSAKLVAISVPLTLYNAVELGELVVGGSQILQGPYRGVPGLSYPQTFHLFNSAEV